MKPRINHSLYQKTGLYLSNKVTLNFHHLMSSNLEISLDILKEAESNPFLTLQYKKTIKPPLEEDLSYDDSLKSVEIESGIINQLKEEILWMNFSSQEKWIAEIILSSVLGNGKLTVSLDQIAQYAQVNLTIVKSVFLKLQEKCPILRLPNEDMVSTYLNFIFQSHPEKITIAKAFFNLLASKMISINDLNKQQDKVLKKIQKYHPEFHLNVVQDLLINFSYQIKVLFQLMISFEQTEVSAVKAIKPDIIISLDQNELDLQVQVYDDYLPEITINDSLKINSKEEEKKYQQALIFLDSLNKRKISLNHLAEYMIKKQYQFFLRGLEYKTPLTMKILANQLKVHPSTISRLLKDKYFYFQGQVKELRTLLDQSVGKTNISKTYVLELINNIIDLEKKYGKISDTKIKQVLENKGIEISRRTINKYRKDLKS